MRTHNKTLEVSYIRKYDHYGIKRRHAPELVMVNRLYHELEHHGICFRFRGIFKIQNGGSAR